MNEELKVIISAEVAKLKNGVDEAKKKVKSFQEQVKEASKDVDSKFAAIGTGISNAAKTMGIGVAAAAGALLALGASTAEYRESQALLKTAFEEAGGSAETAKETYNDLYRVMGDGDAATEAAQSLARLTTDEKALGEYTTLLTGIYQSFGKGMPLETIAEAIAETAACGTITGDLSRALVEAGVSEDAFNESLAACNTEAEREKLIRETLTGLYADAAATYEANNAQVLAQRDAQLQLQEQTAKLGEAVAPLITAFTTFGSEVLAIVVPYIQQLAADYMPQLQEVLSVVAETLGKVMGFLVDNWDIVLTVAAVIGGIATAIGLYNAVAAVKAAMDAAQVATLGALIAAYAAQAAAMIVAIAPYALIVAAIAAVIAIIVVCVKHWDEIKAKVKEVWENIKKWTTEAVEKVKTKFNEMKQAATEKFNAVKETMSNTMDAAKKSIDKSLTNIKKAYEDNGGGIKGIAAATMEAVKGYFSTGYTVLNTLTNGKFGEIVSKIKTKLNDAKTAISNILGDIKQAFSDKLEAAKNTVSNVIEKIKGFFKFEWSLPKLKLPTIKIEGKFSLSPPSVPKFSINWNALGGVFDKPTLFNYGGSLQGLGEAGAEAVVPLEKNTQWLDRIAERLAAKQGSTPIVLTVDGKVFAQTSVNAINQLTRQTGSIGLVMA